MPNSKIFVKVAIPLLLGFAVFIRLIGVSCCVSSDMTYFLIPWYDTLAKEGFSALARPFSNYTPPYLYLLWLVTFTGTFLSKVVAIKILSIVFDIGNAVMVYALLRIRYPQGDVPLLGASLFLALPTIFLNSSFWGQADAIYTFFLLVCIYYLLRDRPLSATIAFAVAFAFKAQASFLAPFLLLLTFRKRIPWYLYSLVPLVYAAMMAPAMMAGRPFFDLITIYLNQAQTYHKLSMNAPNLYLFIPDSLYSPVVTGGLLFTGLIVVIWAIFYSRRMQKDSLKSLILCAAVSALLVPFLLPKMHERYFYLSDVLLFLLAFYHPRVWFLPAVAQFVSILTYFVYLFLKLETARQMIGSFMVLAVLLNTALVFVALRAQYKLMVLAPRHIE